MPVTFNDFLRGLPFTQESIVNVKVVEFENGTEQCRDLWGKNKKMFTINFNMNSKAEITAIQAFYETKMGPGTSFPFINPIDGLSYTVRFVENSFKIERKYFGSYFASCQVVEVF